MESSPNGDNLTLHAACYYHERGPAFSNVSKQYFCMILAAGSAYLNDYGFCHRGYDYIFMSHQLMDILTLHLAVIENFFVI